jgi:hypothetical protein
MTCVKPLCWVTKETKLWWIHIKENLSFHRLHLKLKYSTQFPSSDLSFPPSVPDGKAEKGVPLYAVPDKLKKVASNLIIASYLLSLSGTYVLVGGGAWW